MLETSVLYGGSLMSVSPAFAKGHGQLLRRVEGEEDCPRTNDEGESICGGTLRRGQLISVCRSCAHQFNNKDLDSQQ